MWCGSRSNGWVLLSSGLATLVFSSLALWAFSSLEQPNFWAGWTLGKAGQFEEYCETNRMAQLLREPVNSWTNMAFVWLGFAAWAIAWRERTSTLQQDSFLKRYPVFSWSFGAAMLVLGAGSFFYHASLSRVGQRWDMTGVYAVASFPIVFNGVRTLALFVKPQHHQTLAGAGVVALLGVDVLFYAFKWSLEGKIALPVLFILTLLSFGMWRWASGQQLPWSRLGLALATGSCGVVAWWLDLTKIVCAPESLWQGHGIWHVMMGLSAFFLYLALRVD